MFHSAFRCCALDVYLIFNYIEKFHSYDFRVHFDNFMEQLSFFINRNVERKISMSEIPLVKLNFLKTLTISFIVKLLQKRTLLQHFVTKSALYYYIDFTRFIRILNSTKFCKCLLINIMNS